MADMTRRKVLGAMAAVPVAGPQIVKAAGRIGAEVARGNRNIVPTDSPVSFIGPDSESPLTDPWELYRVIGVPDFVKEQLKRQHRYRAEADNIDCLKSVSEVHKARMKLEQDVTREIEGNLGRRAFQEVAQRFCKKHEIWDWQ